MTKPTSIASRPPSTSWTPNTSYQLSQGPLYFDILDHFFENAEEARSEVLNSQLILSKLQPARTTGDAQLQNILLLAGSSIHGNDHVLPTSRGDKSTFLPKEVRSSHSFSTKHPYLVELLETLEATVRANVAGSFKLEPNASVQLAMYPGDGTSGYPKHCDVGGVCGREASTGASQTPSRILTALYYLTPSDWSPQKDQGHLRLFQSTNSSYDAAPRFNRCIVFRSDQVAHQVMPSKRRDRLAITMWFYGYPQKQFAGVPQTTISLQQQLAGLLPQQVNTILPPPLTIMGEPDSTSTIFVSIASYRDSETTPTIRALFSTAQFPDRIVVGLVYQFDPEEDAPLVFPPNKVRVMSLHSRDARGPCYARRLAQLLYKGEDYVMQIDSHMRFRHCWDTYLLHQLSVVSGGPNYKKALLTTYPVGYTLPNHIPNEIRPTLLVPWKFDSSGMLRQRARLLTQPSVLPIPTNLYAAGFNFGPGPSNEECPYPTFTNVFFGEEVYRAIQFHTAGYQMYAPSETVVYHLWSRSHRPVHSCTAVTLGDDPQDSNSTVNINSNNLDAHALLEYLNNHVPSDMWKLFGVASWTERKLLPGASLGGMAAEEDFVPDQQANLSQQIASLDPEAQAVLAAFLSQMR